MGCFHLKNDLNLKGYFYDVLDFEQPFGDDRSLVNVFKPNRLNGFIKID